MFAQLWQAIVRRFWASRLPNDVTNILDLRVPYDARLGDAALAQRVAATQFLKERGRIWP
jgi:hypothetical protein